MRTKIQTIGLITAIALVTAACAGGAYFRAHKTTLTFTQGIADLQQIELRLYQEQSSVEEIVRITEEQHVAIQNGFLRMGVALELVGQHLMAGEGASAAQAVDEVLSLLDDLVEADIVRLQPTYFAVLIAAGAVIKSTGAFLVDVLPSVDEPIDINDPVVVTMLGSIEDVLATAANVQEAARPLNVNAADWERVREDTKREMREAIDAD